MDIFVDHKKIEELKRNKRIKKLEQELLLQDELMAEMFFNLMMLQEMSIMTMSLGARSPKFDTIKKWYDRGFWDEAMLEVAVEKGQITEDEMNEILSK